MITQETIHALKCLCKGNLSSSSEISVLPSVFLQSKEYCFFWFFWHLFQEETEMFVFPWHMKKGITLGYLLFSYVEPAASWLHLSHTTELIPTLSLSQSFWLKILWLRFYTEEKLKNLNGFAKDMERVTLTQSWQESVPWSKPRSCPCLPRVHLLIQEWAVHMSPCIFWYHRGSWASLIRGDLQFAGTWT